MATKNRALFIDLLKGLALAVMIEVHIFNSLLIPELRGSWWWPSLNFINGLVAPSFTFTSGMVFVLSLQKGTDELRKFGKDFWKKISRIGFIFLAGYALHIPYFSFRKIMSHLDFDTLSRFFVVDVLQVIATGLLILLFAKIIFKSDRTFYDFSAVATFLVLLLGPFAWRIDFANYLPVFFSQYFNRMHGSLFPVFPWWAFLFAGAYTSKIYINARSLGKEKQFARQLLFSGTVFYIASVLFLYVFFPQTFANIIPHPFFFLERFGVIIFMLGAGWFYINSKENYKSFLLDVSRESLLVYWIHLQLIYRPIFVEKSLADTYGNKLNLPESALVTFIIIVVMVIYAKGWGWLKRNRPLWAKIILYASILIALLFLMIRPH
jgi:uncharacterized membrane protein